MRRRIPRRKKGRVREDRFNFWRDPAGKKPEPPKKESYIGFLRKLFDRDGWACRNPFCGTKREPTNHHILKRSLGGKTEMSNCVTICFSCHRANEDGKLKIEKSGVDPMIVSFEDRRYGMSKSIEIRNEAPYKQGGKI